MQKISMDMCCDPETGERISPDYAKEIFSACLTILDRLGNLAGAIEAFRITFVRYEGSKKAGPVITIHFSNFVGKKSSHTSDYRFMGSPDYDKSFEPNADQIAESFFRAGTLKGLIEEHLQRSKTNLEDQLCAIESLLC